MSQLLCPLLAPSQTLTDKSALALNRYPYIASPKYDGIRATIQYARMISRTLKPLPNQYMARILAPFESFDGEIVCGDPTMDGGFNYTQSVVMGSLEPTDWKFYAFDRIGVAGGFEQRNASLHQFEAKHERVVIAPQWVVNSYDELMALEFKHRKAGWEGIMLRDPEGVYPARTEGENRCTFLQENVLKFKRFEDSEGKIIGFYEGKTNTNPAFKDERGRTKRSTHKAGMVPNGHCGGFIVEDPKFGWTCDVAPGKFTKPQLKDIFENPAKYLGRGLKYSFQLKGEMTLPRFPVALGFRDNQE